MKLSNAQDRFIKSIPLDRSTVTKDWYQRMTNNLITFTGDIPLSHLTPECLNLWRQNLIDSPRKPGGINTTLTANRVWLNWLYKNGHLTQPIHLALKKLRYKRIPRSIPETDKHKIIRSATSSRDQAVVRLLAAIGCRRAALARITINDLQFRRPGREWQTWHEIKRLDLQDWRGKVQLREKGDVINWAYFGERTCQALFTWLNERPDQNTTNLFTGRKGALTPDGIAAIIRRLSREIDTTGPTNPHAWRHGFAKSMLKRGADISTVSKLLGHSDVYFTAETYVLWDDEELEEHHRLYGFD